MIEVAIRNLLTEDATVAGLVDGRVYFVNRPQDERRASIVLTLISAVPGVTFLGSGGYANGRMQVTALAPTYSAAKTLAAAVRGALDGFSGTQDDTAITYLETENVRDIPALPLAGAASAATYGVAVDVKFMHQE